MKLYIGIGSNIGDRFLHIQKAIREVGLIPGTTLIRVSSIYETEPFGYMNQNWFYNAVLELQTELDPYYLLESTQAIENRLGREKTIKWGPRRIDLDLLAYDGIIVKSDRLILPHPHMSIRKFVLVPLAEIAPFFIHPVYNYTIWYMLGRCPEEKVLKIREKI